MKSYQSGMLCLAALAGLGPAGCNRDAPAPVAAMTGDPAEAPPEIPVMGAELPILAFGDSLFAGYGLKSGESYPAQLERALRARGINARIANAGVSGDTSAAGLQRFKFTLDNQPAPPALALVELGANDMLRGLPPGQTRTNLDQILEEFDRRHIPVVLMGMLAAPNLGADYVRQFDSIYPQLAKAHKAALVPFFLQAVIADPQLRLPDRLHPTAAGVTAIVAATIDTVAGAVPRATPVRRPDPAPL